jgi:hypothetical protein
VFVKQWLAAIVSRQHVCPNKWHRAAEHLLNQFQSACDERYAWARFSVRKIVTPVGEIGPNDPDQRTTVGRANPRRFEVRPGRSNSANPDKRTLARVCNRCGVLLKQDRDLLRFRRPCPQIVDREADF